MGSSVDNSAYDTAVSTSHTSYITFKINVEWLAMSKNIEAGCIHFTGEILIHSADLALVDNFTHNCLLCLLVRPRQYNPSPEMC